MKTRSVLPSYNDGNSHARPPMRPIRHTSSRFVEPRLQVELACASGRRQPVVGEIQSNHLVRLQKAYESIGVRCDNQLGSRGRLPHQIGQ